MPWRVAEYVPSLRWLRIGIGLLPLAVAVVWAWQSWIDKRAAAIESSRQNTALISEYVLRIMQSQKLLLLQIDNIVSEDPDANEEQLHRKLRILDAGFEFTTSLGVIGPNGRARAGSRTYPLVLDISEREYFTALRDHDLPLYIDRIVLRPNRLDTLLLGRRLSGEGFRGIATASIEIKNLTDFLSTVAGSDAAAFLLRADGKLLVRPDPNAPAVIMKPDGPVMSAIAQADVGVFDAPGYMDGVGRTYVYQKIENFPLYAIHGFSRSALMRSVIIDMAPIAIFLLVLALLSSVALSAVVKRIAADSARQLAEFDRKLLEDAQRLAAFKETLLKEMNHRIHNNLQMIQALIYTRSRAPAGDTATMLKEIGKRVWAISEVHNLLYNTAEYSQIDLGAFLRTMANNPGIVPPEQGILVRCETDKVEVALEQAVPAALIVLEFLTNALKHGFPDGRAGSIAITLLRWDTEAEITVMDDGIGMPLARSRDSGMKLTQTLADQIGGVIEVSSMGSGGTIARLRFRTTVDATQAAPKLAQAS